MPMQAYYISLLILLEKDILSDFSLKMSLGYFYFFLVIHLFNIGTAFYNYYYYIQGRHCGRYKKKMRCLFCP